MKFITMLLSLFFLITCATKEQDWDTGAQKQEASTVEGSQEAEKTMGEQRPDATPEVKY